MVLFCSQLYRSVEFPKTDRPVIIETKGLPFTGCQTLSIDIAKWAKCPIFSMHAILKLLSEENGYGNPYLVPPESEVERLNRLGFSILCTMARSNLKSSMLDHVVIESPLSSTHQLQQLLDNFVDAWIIIVECRVKNKHGWRMRYFQDRLDAWLPWHDELMGEDRVSRAKMWFAPRNWEDAEKAIEEYDAQAWDGYFRLKCSENPYLRRIVLDPKRDVRYTEFKQREGWTPNFVEALKYVLTRGSHTVVELEQWRKEEMERRVCLRVSPYEKRSNLCENGDCLFTYEDQLEHKATCMACDEEITHQAYTCHLCTLALHKSCAEFHLYKPKFLYNDRYFWDYLSRILRFEFSKVHPCKSCKVFSYRCMSCILKTHLKSHRIPVIINDGYHEHILSIRLAAEGTLEHMQPRCQACGDPGGGCSYFCMFYRYGNHIRCATSPRELEHEHGGYNHLMKLKSSRAKEEEEEDYWCDVCFKDMDPECWFYSCQQCPRYVAHLHCVMVKPEHQIYKAWWRR